MTAKSAMVTACIQPESRRQFNEMMETGYNQAKSGEGLPVEEAFAKIWREADMSLDEAGR